MDEEKRANCFGKPLKTVRLVLFRCFFLVFLIALVISVGLLGCKSWNSAFASSANVAEKATLLAIRIFFLSENAFRNFAPTFFIRRKLVIIRSLKSD